MVVGGQPRDYSYLIRVVYIMGAGRSGSTILGTTLGNGRNAFFAGELTAYPRQAGIPSRKSTTGPPPELLELWARVRANMNARGQPTDVTWHSAFEHPRSLHRQIGRKRSRRLKAYALFCSNLYEAIADETSSAVVIDSSHNPLRRWYLRKLNTSIDIYTIHLVRDPRSVIAALQTDDFPGARPKSTFAANLYLGTVHALSEAVYGRLPRKHRLRVRYEDFMSNPDAVVSRLAGWSGIDPTTIRLDALEPGPVFAGNRLIHQPVVALRRAKGTVVLPETSKLTRILQTPWLNRYGYDT
jgi:hypothetical protein